MACVLKGLRHHPRQRTPRANGRFTCRVRSFFSLLDSVMKGSELSGLGERRVRVKVRMREEKSTVSHLLPQVAGWTWAQQGRWGVMTPGQEMLKNKAHPTVNLHTQLFPQQGTQAEQGAVGRWDGADISENIIRLLEVPVFFFFHLIKGTYKAPTLKHSGIMLVLRIKAWT